MTNVSMGRADGTKGSGSKLSQAKARRPRAKGKAKDDGAAAGPGQDDGRAAPPRVELADVWPAVDDGPTVQVEGVEYVRAYYTGMTKVFERSILRYEVKDAPVYGEQGALILSPNDQGRRKKATRLTLFCPFTLQANSISDEAGEINTTKFLNKERRIEGVPEPIIDKVQSIVPRPRIDLTGGKIDRLSDRITENWKMRCKLGLPFDLDVAALVLTRFGKPIPEERPNMKVDSLTGEAKKTGGKEAGPELVKAVSSTSQQGKVLRWFMDQKRSITEGMAEFGSTRSALQSHLFRLWKDNGIGYGLTADMVDIVLPAGCEDPFLEPKKSGATKQEKPVAKANRGKPMQDELLITPLPEKGKRREVAVATYQGWKSIASIAMQLDCSEGSIKSHLNDLHIKHGYGFELNDKGEARLLVPKGWTP